MNFSSGFTLLLVLTLFLDFSAGCMSSDNGIPSPHYGKSLDQISRGNNVNNSKWIVIDPISDIKVGEKITVTAKTNLSSGTWVSVQTWPYSYNPVNRTDASGSSGISASVVTTVKEGNAGVNIIAFAADSKNFRPEPYNIVFFNDTENASAGTWYNISIEPERMPGKSPSPCLADSKTANDEKSSRFWIVIDPVSHHYLGDIITFHGTTNLLPGEVIETVVYSGEFAPCPKSTGNCRGNVTPCCGGYSGNVPVLAGTCGINTWGWDVSTSQHGFRLDGEYIISASGRTGAVNNFSIFTVSGIPKSNITLNLPENDTGGFTLRFSGRSNTGNGPDEILLLTISSDSGKTASYTVPVYRNGTGYFWNSTLKKSVITPYNFLSVNVSSQTSPDLRIERTFLYNNEPAFYPYNPTSP